ncbi:DUF3180 domain-containing protein [Bifidobacterium vansinderenii]|uniref:DUF3180 domain-containing protein n=1 Tax=Bifidobacterium vansinderenii TaxID=1984871 RepID=A0A229VYN7_9BIFI|nr:DUF3180 domain-containing protein [Bifidobacterium vansinderenii]OXN00731.1 hypothetical protein Tam10B_0993 [Bifidobacterium vansinderenii]
MKARRTPWWYYAIAVILGGFAGVMLVKLTEHSEYTFTGAPWIVPVLLGLLGVLVLVLSWQVHKYVKGDLKDLSMERAVNTLVLAKSLGVAGAALVGWYGGQLVMCLPHLDAEYYANAALECGVAAVVCLADMIIGIVGEYWCQLPPHEGPEHPQVKEAERLRGAAPAANAAGAANRVSARRRHESENGRGDAR